MNDSSRQTKFLKDYAPPDYLIEEVALDVGLAPKAARVVSKLKIRPNPEAPASGQPLVLDGEALTDLRLLISSAMDVAPPLKILLVGQEALRSTLKRSQHGDLLNRIGVHYRLKPLTKEQTGRYIDVQMKQAGGAEDIFDQSVKELIHDFTGGVPRAINNLATACLLQAVAQGVLRIDEALFQKTSTEFQLG